MRPPFVEHAWRGPRAAHAHGGGNYLAAFEAPGKFHAHVTDVCVPPHTRVYVARVCMHAHWLSCTGVQA